MANADFDKQNTAQPGGFGTGSYRDAQAKAEARSLTPLQQKLAKAEKALPAALTKTGVAAAVLAVMLVLGVFGIGGAKLHSRYAAVANAATTGVAEDVSLSNDYTIRLQLDNRDSTAQSVIMQAAQTLGEDNAFVAAAQEALAALQASRSAGLGAQYDANLALGTAVDALYAAVQETSDTPLQMGAIQTAYSSFTSAGRMLANLGYNRAAQQYNEEAAGFPANVLGALWGCGKVELFA